MTAVLHEPAIAAPALRATDVHPMATDALLHTKAAFPRDPRSVGNARRWLVDTLAGWGVNDDDAHTAKLLLSETASNAVVHAAGEGSFRVEVWLWGVELTVSVYDPDPASSLDIPEQRDSAEHGRGLMIVKAMAYKCGVDRTDAEKRTWFSLMTGGI